MKSHLDVYHATLKALSPVFVGSGRSIMKQEYLVDQSLTIHVFDLPKLYARLNERNLGASYENFLRRSGRFSEWMTQNHIKLQDISDCVRYRLRNSDLVLAENELKTLEIQEFAKDPYGLPYVPGSGIKGMLRTVLLSSEIMNDRPGFDHFKDEVRRELDEYIERDNKFDRHKPNRFLLKSQADSIEARGFRTLECDRKNRRNAVNDILKGFIVGDSEPLSTDQLSVCQRIETHRDGTESKLNVTRECLKPGTKINFTLTVDRSVCKYTAESILGAVRQFGESYNTYFVEKFEGAEPLPEGCLLLGGGCGFASKTVTYPLFGEDGVPQVIDIFWGTLPEKIFTAHQHDESEEYDLAPHILKTSRYQGKLYQTGVCKIEFRKLK